MLEPRPDVRSPVSVIQILRSIFSVSTFFSSLSFFPWQISEELKERLLEFHKKAGLGFGAYDFLERGDDVIFLECNPGGAWLWLEQSLGLKVSEQVAKCLLGINETKSS